LDTVGERFFHVKMQIKKEVITTIFDSGGENNLILKKLVKQLGLKMTTHHKSLSFGMVLEGCEVVG
jgi:hypothetical protein